MKIPKDMHQSSFGNDKKSIWRQFADENLGIQLTINENGVQYLYNDFTITFDTYKHYVVVGGSTSEAECTRGIAEFVCTDNFKLLITQQGFIDNIAKLFGLQDIQIGDKLFDKKFVIKSNDELKTFLLLSNNSIIKLLRELKAIRFDITDGEGLSLITTQSFTPQPSY